MMERLRGGGAHKNTKQNEQNKPADKLQVEQEQREDEQHHEGETTELYKEKMIKLIYDWGMRD